MKTRISKIPPFSSLPVFMPIRSREATEARFSEPVAGSFGSELCEQRSEAELGKGGSGGNPIGAAGVGGVGGAPRGGKNLGKIRFSYIFAKMGQHGAKMG